MIQGEITKERMEGWKFDSSCEEGFHEIIAPGKADCEQEYIYRLNLSAGKSFDLETGKLEMDAVCIKGAADFSWDGYAGTCDKLDSFYVVSNMKVRITAKEDCIFYITGAVDEGYGKPFFRKCDLTMPIGEIHQIHGSGVSQREVFMTIDPGTASSRLLVGLTWGGNGAWTSWPPHEHEKDLEEVYCYFDMDDPHFGLHLSYVEPGDTHGVVALFYGLTKREHIEKKYLHGEVVSYGTLVNLMVDKDWDKLKMAYGVNKSIDLPVCLADLELEKDDKLEDVLEATMANQEMTHTPYPVTKEMIYQAIQDLEDYKG